MNVNCDEKKGEVILSRTFYVRIVFVRWYFTTTFVYFFKFLRALKHLFIYLPATVSG